MDERPKAIGTTRLFWSLVLGLGLALGLLWTLMAHPAAEAQVMNPPDDAVVGRGTSKDSVAVHAADAVAEPHIRLERNDDYYDAGAVVITQATSLFIDQDEAWTRYQSGELDTIEPPGSALETIRDSPVYSPQLHAYPRQCAYYYGFSHDVPPFDDPLVRAAFASAIDRPRLIREVETLSGDEFPALTLAPPGTFGYVDGYAMGIGRPYSPTVAQNLLAASGYTGTPTITLMFNTSPGHQAIAEAIRQMWIDTLGITVTLEDLEWGSYLDLLREGSVAERPGVFRMSWCADYPDAHNWHSGANGWWLPIARYENPAYDALVEAAARETDPAVRLELYEQAEATLVMTDTAILPLYYFVNHRLTRPELDRTYRPFGGQHLDEWNFIGDVRPLKVAWGSPASLDPALSQDWDYVEQLFLGLTDFDADGNVVPELATGWDVSPDGTVYTFTMRSDATWTDGNPVTAHDVEYGVLRSLDPDAEGWYAPYVLGIIENAQAYNQGSITDPDLVGVEALDATHVRFTLEEPGAYFPLTAGLPPARPQPQWAIETYGCGWTAPEHIVTNGPYKLTAWEGPSHLSINKGADGDPIAGETFVFHIAYQNAGASPAADTVITDTMMGGMTYISDTSSFAHTGSGAPGDPLVWDLGSVPAHSCEAFDVYVQVTAGISETITNRANIATSNPDDLGESWEKESEWSGHVRLSPLALAMRVNYGHDWVEGNYEAGHTLWITVTESDGSTVKATAELQTQEIPWWGGRTGFSTNLGDPWVPGRPDIVPGDYVHGLMDNGYASTVRIGTINGELDVDADTIAGTIHANWFTQTLNANCGVWEPGGPGQGFEVDPDGGSYFCDFGAMGWDLLPGHDVGVQYQEPDGDQVYNVFREPAPDMRVEKWAEGDQVAPNGPVVFTIRYRNEGDAVAESVLLTDTLPAHTSYLTDSSGFPVSLDGRQVTWAFGPAAPGEQEQFQLVLTNTASPSETLRNEVDIYTLYDFRDHNDHAEAEVHVAEGQPDLYVNKHPNPGDPASDETMLWEINYGNNGPVASGPVALTDTIPQDASIVSWYSRNGYNLWTDHSTAGQLMLEAPTIPGHWGDRILLRLQVDPGVEVGTQLTNTVEITTAGDSNPGNNWDQRNDVWVNWPRWNGYVDKNFGWGQLVPGGEVGYNVHIRNNGNTATQTWLTDTLPQGTSFNEVRDCTGPICEPFPPGYVDDEVAVWDLGMMEPGQWYNLNVRLSIDSDTVPGTVLTNCAEIAIDGDDDWPYDNADCAVDTVRDYGPNLRVYKESEWDWKDQIEYEIHFENIGSETLYDVAITDTLPLSTSFSGDWWHDFWENVEFTQVDNQLVWALSRIEPGWSSRIHYKVDLDGDIIGDQGLAFTNTVEAPIPDDVYPDDNYDTMTAYTGPDLFAEKWISDGEPRPGERITFTLRAGNRNQWPWRMSDDADARLIERLPAGMSYVRSLWPDGTPYSPFFHDPDAGLVMWNMGHLGSDDVRLFYLVVQLDADLEGDDVLLNQLEIQESPALDVDPIPENNTFVYPVAVLQPKFEVGKVYESSRIAGTIVTYTLTVTNVGAEAATNVVVTDALPAGLTYGGSDGTFDGSDVSWTLATVAADGGTASGWFSATLPSTVGLEIINDDYGVRGSDQGVSGPAGAPVSFTVEPRRVYLPLVMRNS